MRKNRILALILTLVMVISLTACGSSKTSQIDPLMWIVKDGEGGCLYLMGTIHVGDERMENLPLKVTKTMDTCDYLAVEFDILETENNTAGLLETMKSLMYTDGTTIKDHIDGEIYEDAKKIMEDSGIYNSALDYYVPIMWQQFVSEAFMQKTDLKTEYGADRALIEYANEKNIEVLDIESMELQMDMLKSLSPETQEYLLGASVLTTEDMYNKSLNAMYESWVDGDREKLETLVAADSGLTESVMNDEAKAAMDEYNEKMLTIRNQNMALAAERYIDGGATVLLAVGTAHMFGDDGIISLLESKGYTVEEWQ